MDQGIQYALSTALPTPLPQSWLGRADAPMGAPGWAVIDALSSTQMSNLVAQIGYDLSQWDYTKINLTGNLVGRYQFTPQQLEDYGLLAKGSNLYGTACVNRKICWASWVVDNYIHDVRNLSEFLSSSVSQDHLAYYHIDQIYTNLKKVDAVLTTDTADIVAGMIYVGWMLGAGAGPTTGYSQGTGAYAWRYYNAGAGTNYYNAGRYAVSVLSQ